jgi:hypothetical protein
MLDGAARVDEVVAEGGGRRPAGDRHHRPRQHVRRPRVLQGVPQAGRQAHHRHRGLHGARLPPRAPGRRGKVDDSGGEAEGGKKLYYHLTLLAENNHRATATSSSSPAGRSWRATTTSPGRLGAARRAPRGHRHHRLPRRPRAAVLMRGDDEGALDKAGAPAGHLRARTTSSSRSRTTASPPSTAPTPSCFEIAKRSAPRCSPPTTATTPTARTPWPTTRCCACRPAR